MGKGAVIAILAVGMLAVGLLVLRNQRRKEIANSIVFAASLRESRGRVGQPLPVEFRLRNGGGDHAWVVTGDVGGGAFLRIQVFDSLGQDLRWDARGCATRDFIRRRDYVLLGPGEATDPLPERLSVWWRPPRPGRYTVVATYLYTPPDIDFRWIPFRNLTEEVPEDLHSLARQTFRLQRSVRVDIDVDR